MGQLAHQAGKTSTKRRVAVLSPPGAVDSTKSSLSSWDATSEGSATRESSLKERASTSTRQLGWMLSYSSLQMRGPRAAYTLQGMIM